LPGLQEAPWAVVWQFRLVELSDFLDERLHRVLVLVIIAEDGL
jgi:hypothetical protein